MQRRSFIATAAVGVTAGAAGCSGGSDGGDGSGGGGATPTRTPESTPTEVPDTPTPGPERLSTQLAVSHYPIPSCSLPLVVGQNRNVFSEEFGLDIEGITSFGGGGTTVRGIVTGGIGAGVGASLPAVVQAFNAGAPIHLVGLACGSNDLAFQALADSDVETIQDLVGGTIACSNPGAVSEATAIASVQNADGITLDDVELMFAGGLGEALTAVQEGAADVAFNISFNTINFENKGFKTVWRAREHAPNLTEGTIAMGARVLDETPDLGSTLVGGFATADEYIKNNITESAAMWAEANDVPSELTEEVLTRIVDPAEMFDVSLDEDVLKATADTMIAQGLIDEQPPWGELIRQDPIPDAHRVDWV